MMLKRIAVNKLHHNPCRDFTRNPMREKDVQSLMDSIKRNDLWHGIVARPLGRKPAGEYQIAFGHHRLEAIKRLGIEEIELDVADLTDAQMIQYLSDENQNQGGRTPAAAMESIVAAKHFLDECLRQAESAHHFMVQTGLNEGVPGDTLNNQTWSTMKSHGSVGRKILRKFIGIGWSDEELAAGINVVEAEYAKEAASKEVEEATASGDTEKVKQATEKLKKADQDTSYRDIIEMFPHMRNATTYVRELKRREENAKPVPKTDQIRFARELIADGTGKRDIPRVLTEKIDGLEEWRKQEHDRVKMVKKKAKEKRKSWKDEWTVKHRETPDEYMRDTLGILSQLESRLTALSAVIEYSEDEDTLRAFLSRCAVVRDQLNSYAAGLSQDFMKEVVYE